MTKDELYREYVWPTAIQRVKDSPTHLLLLPGIMGSELYDEPGASELWVTLFGYGDHMRGLEFSAVGPTGSTDAPGREVYAPREIVLRPITDPYGKLLNHPGLRPGVYPFDWREDMAFEERRLASFLRELATTVPKVSIVTHSMGGPMLLHLLGQQPSLAANIERIVFCAPPFHGAIKPLSAIETGSDVPTPPWGSYQDGVMRAAASFGGLFQLLVSPRKQWPMKLPDAGEGSVLIDYPIVSDVDLYTTSAWSNPYHVPWREQLLGRAARFHEELSSGASHVLALLSGRVDVVVAANCKTYETATRLQSGWWLEQGSIVADDKYFDGDGTVLFESSFLPDLDRSHYFALAPAQPGDLHGEILDQDPVLAGLQSILSGAGAGPLEPYRSFVSRIAFGHTGGVMRGPDYLEREKWRGVAEISEWDARKLSPEGDVEQFHLARQAAFKVLGGSDSSLEAQRINVSPEFLRRHVRKVAMPFF